MDTLPFREAPVLPPQDSALAQEKLVRSFMPELDTLRGIAVLGVLFLHGFEWQYGGLHFAAPARLFLLLTQPGWIGVNLFFVLSGFLITGILLESRDRPDYYRRFYARRALRILPPYYLLLILLGLLHQASMGFLGLSFIYLANLTSFFGVAMDYGPLWSLAVEEHYYILWPTVVRKLKSRSLVVFSTAICAAVPISRAIAFRYNHRIGIDWYTWFVADGLATGSLLAVLLRSSIRRRQVASLCAALMAGALALAAAGVPFGILSRQSLLGAAMQFTVINTFFAGFLLLFLLLGTSSWKFCVNRPVLQFFGYISYGLYLFHIIVFRIYDKCAHAYWPQLEPSAGHFSLVLVRFAVAGGAAVALSYLSRKYYEERFLRLKNRIPSSPLPAPAAVVSQALASVATKAKGSA